MREEMTINILMNQTDQLVTPLMTIIRIFIIRRILILNFIKRNIHNKERITKHLKIYNKIKKQTNKNI